MLRESKATRIGEESRIVEFLKYRERLKKNKNVVTIVNHPCLEYWIFIHFEFSQKHFHDCKNVCRQLKLLLKDYEKSCKYFTRNNNDIYLRLKPKLKEAIANTKKLKKFNYNNPAGPFTEMQLFFETSDLQNNILTP
ncbi:MAG: RloB domain-containing protein [Bacteroidota bacterium]|nr:RloB domain-containing protein [Bacteroidota bacterium]